MASRFDRAKHRNVFLYGSRDRDTLLGGLRLPQVPCAPPAAMTCKGFHVAVDVLLVVDGQYMIQDESGAQLERSESPLQPGNYIIVTSDDITVSVNSEPLLTRTISLESGRRTEHFRDAVRNRDGCCVITRQPPVFDDFTGFHAAHVFPIAYEKHWIDHNFSRWITIPPQTGGSINSVQNGLLMLSNMHVLFDTYAFSINPDEDYKIVWFRDRGTYGHHDGRLPPSTIQDPQRPSDELLRWHFRQAVFANMRANAEPVFEFDFPPGTDDIGEICNGPKAAERLEAELFGRLALDTDYSDYISNDEAENDPAS